MLQYGICKSLYGLIQYSVDFYLCPIVKESKGTVQYSDNDLKNFSQGPITRLVATQKYYLAS